MDEFAWTDFLDVVEKMLREFEPDQATLRIVASRAYYAAFNSARLYVQHRFPEESLPSHGAVHERVPSLLRTSKGVRREERSIGENLKRLKDLRTRADYNARVSVSEGEANHCIEMARRTTHLLEQLASRLPGR